MNEHLNHSRRSFVRNACLSLAVPAMFPSMIAAKTPAVKNTVPDLDKLKNLLTATKPNIWLFTGDSITHGALHTHGYRSYPEVFSERVRWEMRRMRDVVINTGISGNTTRHLTDEFDWRIGQFKPAMVSLMIGTNDCSGNQVSAVDYEKNLNTLVVKIRDLGSVPVFQTPNCIAPGKATGRENLSEYVSLMKQVAEKQQVVLIDHWELWKQAASQADLDIYNKWLDDPVHPNGRGHLEMARLIFKELAIFDPKALTCLEQIQDGNR